MKVTKVRADRPEKHRQSRGYCRPRLRTDINLPRRMSGAERRLARATSAFERRFIGGMQQRTWRYG